MLLSVKMNECNNEKDMSHDMDKSNTESLSTMSNILESDLNEINS